MTIDQEKSIAAHYTTADLLENIRNAITAAGKNPENMTADDLKGVDEFHTGGVQATDDLLKHE
ncbi:MAG: hypothetical protein WBD34_22210 [Burkholderiaceae bacterium]